MALKRGIWKKKIELKVIYMYIYKKLVRIHKKKLNRPTNIQLHPSKTFWLNALAGGMNSLLFIPRSIEIMN